MQLSARSLTVGIALAVAGCGGGGSAVDSTKTATSAKARAKTLSPSLQAQYNYVWSGNNLALLDYCVHKIGAAMGKQQPPTATMRQGEQLAIYNLRLWAQQSPMMTLDGKPLGTVIVKTESQLTQGCDTPGARLLRDTIAAMESGKPIHISSAEEAAATPR